MVSTSIIVTIFSGNAQPNIIICVNVRVFSQFEFHVLTKRYLKEIFSLFVLSKCGYTNNITQDISNIFIRYIVIFEESETCNIILKTNVSISLFDHLLRSKGKKKLNKIIYNINHIFDETFYLHNRYSAIYVSHMLKTTAEIHFFRTSKLVSLNVEHLGLVFCLP